MNTWKITFCLLLALSPLHGTAAPISADTLQITGVVIKPVNWSIKDLRRQFAASLQPIQYTHRGIKHTARAVSLWTVLQTVQPRTNPQIKNHELQFTVLVQGHDGYTVAFSLPELSPDFGHENVWLVLDEDGKPLSSEDGLAELVVPDDIKAGRWVHSVTKITVVDEAQTGTTGKA
ncbi:MAG: molybdopterin-dependent oxidoreductase [Janthinobacterium lividum]